MKNPDTRIRYTKMILHQAMLTLLEEKPLGKITVKELCDTAELNRGTFYLHYNSPEELLNEIEEQFLEENFKLYNSYWAEERNLKVMSQIYSSIIKNRDICRILLGDNSDSKFIDRLKSLVREGLLDEWQKEFPEYERTDLDFLFDYVFDGSMKLLIKWLKDDHNLPIDEFTRRMERLGHYSLVAVGEFNQV